MSAFAKNGNRVLFIDNTGIRAPNFKDIPRLKKRFRNWIKSIKGFRKEGDNLYVYSPVILPFPYFRLVRLINKYMFIRPIKRWMKVMNFHNPIIWTFLPNGASLDIINNIDYELVIYYCIADFYELSGNPDKVKVVEDRLIRKSELIFVQGEVLEKRCRRLNDNVYIFPFGVNIEAFGGFQHELGKLPDDIKSIKKPIIGYIGGIHRHIDFDLIYYIARAHPEWSIVLVGPIQTDIGKNSWLKNIFLLGKKDFLDLPGYIGEFDVGIIPYNISGYTATVFPTKLNEYHAMGKPVVSTDIPEVVNFNAKNENLVSIAKTAEEFTECLRNAIQDKDEKLKTMRVNSARKNSWEVRIEEMSIFIEDALNKKLKYAVNWQERLLKIYKFSREKITKACVAALCFYLVLFYTPLVWFMAAPLKIIQAPQKSDCIVVFAGGVGESGKPGQGYEERVQYAVELYKKGYAKNILFSSGYTYVFEEPLVMKALAVSLGVLEDAIILDDRAKNTYENVKFTKDILEKHGWGNILLISSPYHMLRSQLVFNKIARAIKAIYTPMPNSLFYAHQGKDADGKRIWKRINLRQINGILHEYLGIIYYWWRGWV